MPAPSICHSPTPSRSTRAPRARSAAAVAITSSASSRPRTRLRPAASADSISARCEIDLSPGTATAPFSGPPRRAVSAAMPARTGTWSAAASRPGRRPAPARRRRPPTGGSRFDGARHDPSVESGRGGENGNAGTMRRRRLSAPPTRERPTPDEEARVAKTGPRRKHECTRCVAGGAPPAHGIRLPGRGLATTVRRPSPPWGHSSVGRALEWHSRGRGFDSPWLHHSSGGGIRDEYLRAVTPSLTFQTTSGRLEVAVSAFVIFPTLRAASTEALLW